MSEYFCLVDGVLTPLQLGSTDKENQASVNIVDIDHDYGQASGINNSPLPSIVNDSGNFWNSKTTKLLIEEYKILQNPFRDPKIKKKQLWTKIKQTFEKKGYHISEDGLDRKWRNLKKTFTAIKDNKRKTGRGRLYWEYFNEMEEIYLPDNSINPPLTVTTFREMDCGSTSGVLANSIRSTFGTPQNKLEIIHSSTPATPSTSKLPGEKLSPSTSKLPRENPKSGMYYLRKRLADIEEARLEEIKLLRLAVEKHNNIQEERNKILLELIQNKNK